MDKEDKIKAENKIEEEVAKNGFFHKVKKRKKLFILSLLVIVLIAAFLIFALKLNNSVPRPPTIENVTLSDKSDGTIDFDIKAEEVNLLHAIERDDYLYKLRETNYFLIPRSNIRYARIQFVLQTFKSKDLDMIQENEALISETLNRVMRNHTVEDFEGVSGKEAMRLRVLKALNEKLPFTLMSVRYGALSFH